MHIISVANRKGGVGKSSVATNLAAALALDGKRVVVVDMDSQGSSSAVLLDEVSGPSMAQVMLGEATLAEVVRPLTREGLWIAPAAHDLTPTQLTIAGRPARETILKRALRKLEGYDVCVIDTAPELQLATVNALVAATHVLMPFTPDPMALDGLRVTSDAVAELAAAELGQAVVLGCVQVAFDRRLGITAQSREQVKDAYGDQLLGTCIRANASFFVCPAWHRDIFAIERADRSSRRGSEDFRSLAAEIADRLWKEVPRAEAAA